MYLGMKGDADLLTCDDNKYTNISTSYIIEQKENNNKEFFFDQYIGLLSRPEHMGALYSKQSQEDHKGPIDHESIRIVNKYISGLSNDDRNTMATKFSENLVKLISFQSKSIQYIENTMKGFNLVEKERNIKNQSMIMENIPSHQPAKFQERRRLICRYISILLSHEFLWESMFFTDIPTCIKYYRLLLKIIKGDEHIAVELI